MLGSGSTIPKNQMLNYIKQAKNNAISNEEIVRSLVGVGWPIGKILAILMDNLANPEDFDTQAAVIVRNINKSFGKVQALKDVSLEIKPGTVMALLGPNGAGKTTLVKILTTLLQSDNGNATVAGYDVKHNAKELRSVIGLAGQYAAIDENLSGKENLEMVGRLYHLDKQTAQIRAQELLERFDLLEANNRTAKTYSGGMRRRLDLAASLVTQPKVLFLDEPTTGLDPHGRNSLWQIIKELVSIGTTVLLTTQYMEEADHLANSIVVIDHGQVIAQGTPQELKSQVGGDFLELHVTNHQEAYQAAQLISQLGHEEPYIDAEAGKITLPIKNGASVLTDAVRLLDEADIKIADIILRRPTLDDVFLALTGHLAQS